MVKLHPNISNPDGFYDELLRSHEGLSQEESAAFNARLILVLANEIGNDTILREALRIAEAVTSD